MDYEVKYFQSSQFDDYTSFLKRFSEKDYSTSMFCAEDWWAPANPFEGVLLFAHTTEEIAASCMITGRKLSYSGDVVDCFELDNAWTLPHHRRRGLFTRVITKALELGFAAGRRLIYGTPNNQASPGYRKMGLSFIDNEHHKLVLMPKILNIALRKAGIRRRPVVARSRPDDYKLTWKDMVISEMRPDEYFAATRHFTRMNHVDEAYLPHRLRTSETCNRRFFCASGTDGTFHASVRGHELSFLRPLLVSEYFLNGSIDNTAAKFDFLRGIQRGYYKSLDGIYLKSYAPPAGRRLSVLLKHGYVVHRDLPICYKYSGISKEQADAMMAQLAPVFQLTDCDIG